MQKQAKRGWGKWISANWLASLTVIGLLAAPGAALASDDCHVPMERWQPREAVQQAADAWGWKVDRIKIDDGCYEVRGVNVEGTRFKAKLDPETLELVKWKRKDRDDRRDRRDRRDTRQQAPAGPATFPEKPLPSGILGDGAPPAATIR